MKKSKGILIIFGVLLILIIGTIFMYTKTIKHPLKSNKENVVVEVREGEGFYTLLNELKEKDLIKNELFIKLYLKLNRVIPKVTKGTYTVNTDITLPKFLKTLQTDNSVKIVIPEGYTVSQIADILQENKLFSKEEFLNAVNNYPLPDYIKKDSKRRYALEGFLFPDTYLFPKKSTPNEVIKTMLDKFQSVMKEVENETGVTVKADEIDEVVTKASLIEKEARTEKDRPLISSVIDNRIQKKMPLQIDATVIYALGKHVDKVLYKHLEVESPYNTYKNKGLPVGPIANPGKPSLIAALEPTKTDYIYYLLNPKTGEHYFTNNYSDFEKKKVEFGY